MGVRIKLRIEPAFGLAFAVGGDEAGILSAVDATGRAATGLPVAAARRGERG